MSAVGPYSQAVIAGHHIFVSGQIPADASGKLTEGSIADKTTVSCEGLKKILEAAGSSISRTVKVGCWQWCRISSPTFYSRIPIRPPILHTIGPEHLEGLIMALGVAIVL